MGEVTLSLAGDAQWTVRDCLQCLELSLCGILLHTLQANAHLCVHSDLLHTLRHIHTGVITPKTITLNSHPQHTTYYQKRMGEGMAVEGL
jgi:hypothetical protein